MGGDLVIDSPVRGPQDWFGIGPCCPDGAYEVTFGTLSVGGKLIFAMPHPPVGFLSSSYGFWGPHGSYGPELLPPGLLYLSFSPDPLYAYNYEGSGFSGFITNYQILDAVLLPPGYSVPEPSSLLALVAMGAGFLGYRRAKQRRR